MHFDQRHQGPAVSPSALLEPCLLLLSDARASSLVLKIILSDIFQRRGMRY